MRLKARPGNSGSSVLTCAAFSFYPPELKFRFLRNGLASGSGNCSTGPNGDGSFHAWSLLEVKRGDEHHYQCQVEHEGLAQPLTVDLGEAAPPASVSSLFFFVFLKDVFIYFMYVSTLSLSSDTPEESIRSYYRQL
jgi:hypothetical protein